jgi:hypothetical protein
MPQINNIQGLTVEQINEELMRGAKFVVFPFTLSFIVVTLRRSSNIYFIKSNESALKYGFSYLLITLFFGWWGIPWGPIYTIGSIITHASGGKDITSDVLNAFNSED